MAPTGQTGWHPVQPTTQFFGLATLGFPFALE